MRFLAEVFLILLTCSTSWALHESDVGVVDWYRSFVGVPLFSSPSTAPTFHTTENGTIALTATGNNVLAALELSNGTTLWRYTFNPEDRIAGYFKHQNVVASLSGPGGAMARSFDVRTGEIIFETKLHDPELGVLSEPHAFGKFITFDELSGDLFVLTNGYTINRLDAATGDVKWTWSSPDQTSLNIYIKLLLKNDVLYAIAVAKSTASFSLYITALSPTNGQVVTAAHISSSIVNPLNEITTLSTDESGSSYLVWLEHGTFKTFQLNPSLKGKAVSLKALNFVQLVDVGLNDHGRVLGVQEGGSTLVLKLVGNGTLSTVSKFENSESTDSIYAGGLDAGGNPLIARVYWAPVFEKAVAEVLAEHLGEGQGLTASAIFAFETKTDGVINHIAFDASNTSEWTLIPRVLVTTSTGSVQLWQGADLKWNREESLATTMLAEFIELPERLVLESSHGGEGFSTRFLRHLSEVQDLPRYIVNFIRRFATGSYASTTSTPAPTSSHNATLSRDPFGFRQVIVTATLMGKIFGIDSSNGNILWSRVLGLGWAAEIGGSITPVKIYVTKTVSDGVDPEVVIVVQRRAQNSLVDTVIFHVNALTGDDIQAASAKSAVLEGLDIIQGPVIEAFLLHQDSKVVVMLDEFLQVYLYPDTSATQAEFKKWSPVLSFPLRANADGRQRVMGHQISYNTELSERPTAYPTWSLSLPPGEDVQRVLPPATRGPVASIGKVLGNRTTLYKYLNPRLFTVLTVSPVRNMCGLYLVDSTKGTIVYHAEVKAGYSGCDIKTAFTENWLVYHYYESEVADGNIKGTKGYRMVTVELYEGQDIDDKTRSSDLSSFAHASTDLTAYEQSYVFPHAITALSPTSTKFGITSKDLIVATRSNKIQSFNRRLLNPRRPHRKPSSEEQEEYLFQYDAVLPDDPKQVISHGYEVANVQRIITSPAILESTSLVFAYGLDMFLTRVAPSNTFDVLSENFNKMQLVLTVSGLLFAIIITRPMVQRKRLREKWYQ